MPTAGPSATRGLIVATGRLEPQKNFALAIEAMGHLSRWTDARLVILGDGNETRASYAHDRSDGAAGTRHAGGPCRRRHSLARPRICFLMTSHYEGYPASLVEDARARAAGGDHAPARPLCPRSCRANGLGSVSAPDAARFACAVQTVLRRRRVQSVDPMLLARHDEERAAASYLDLIDRCVRERAC